MRCFGLVFLTLLLLPAPRGHAGEDDADGLLPHTPSRWLVIGPVDHRARRPFNPDAVFARHLLDPSAPPPRAGQTVAGERGVPQTWRVLEANEKGELAGRIAYAYTTIESPRAMVAMAWLRGGGTLFVNGTPHAGAIYGDRFEVPIALRQGTNHVFVKGVRGACRLTLTAPRAGIFLAPFRQAKPDLVAGEPADTVCGLLVVNARTRDLGQVVWAFAGNDWLAPARSRAILPITPLGLVQIRVPLKTRPGKTAPEAPGPIELSLRVSGAYADEGHDATFTVQVRPREKAVVRTFRSQIDDSVQRFGLREPLPGGPEDKGLVLSLHGAGVPPRNQVNAYAPKPDFWIVAPTNRDRFGFDWQDWGRLDAYEVLQTALRISGVDRRRVYLTGHSMGGHGTWHLGANDPDGFAAIAPSAGWIGFDTYPAPRRAGELTPLWHAADGASKTRELLGNLAQLPTFVLHGTEDTNVPADQAREMVKLLTEAGAPPQVHFEDGQGHWWDGHPEPGAQCVDWPGIFDLFRKSRIPSAPREIHIRTMDPSVDAKHHWLEILQPLRYGRPCHVRASWDPARRSLVLQTTNIRALRLEPPIRPVRLNGRTVDWHPHEDGHVLVRVSEDPFWKAHADSVLSEGKLPAASGPLRRGMRNRFVFVHGTTGSEAESAALRERARFDAQRWTYRAWGQAIVLSDRQLLRMLDDPRAVWRNPVLYGNEHSNLAIARLFNQAGPVRARRGALRLGARTWEGDSLGAAWIRPAAFRKYGPDAPPVSPRPRFSHGGLAVVFADAGVRGTRLGLTLMTFVSGAGWPDYVVFDEGILTQGDGGVQAAGWFDHDWRLQGGDFLRPAAPEAGTK